MKVAALLGGARQGRDEGSSTARAAPNGDGEPRKRGAAAAGRCWQQQRRRKKGSSSGDADRTNGDRVSCAGGSSERLCWWIERAVLVDRASCAGGSSERLWSREKAAAAATRIEPTAIERAAVLVARASGCAGGSSERRWRQRAARAAV
ncbi:hypothetical protein ACOSP7_016188 [Xanthoceras sorbifolium]